MNVLIHSIRDYAAVGWHLSKALQSVGVNALAVTRQRRPLNSPYLQKCVYGNRKGYLKRRAKWATHIIWMHSQVPPYAYLCSYDLDQTKQFIFHGGSNYTKDPKQQNRRWNWRVHASLMQSPCIMGLGAANEYLLLPAVDVKSILPGTCTNDRLVIGHFPTRMRAKGTKRVRYVFSKLRKNAELAQRAELVLNVRRVPHDEHMQRMSECDVVIDQVAPKLQKLKMGFFGVTTLEVAALGKIPVCLNLWEDAYRKEYGPSAFAPVGEDNRLIVVLKKLILSPREEIQQKQEAARRWVEKYHSYEATGNRLLEILSCV